MKAEQGLGVSEENLLRRLDQLQIWGRELSRRDPFWEGDTWSLVHLPVQQ